MGGSVTATVAISGDNVSVADVPVIEAMKP